MTVQEKGVFGEMRVLHIEDDSATAQSVELMLKSENFNVYSTDLGEEGVDLGVLYDYDIILLDLNLPDISGYQVLRELRSKKVKTPVLILSGLAAVEDKLKGFGLGADDYMTKPFHKDELVARIHAIARRANMYSGSVIIDNLVVDLDKKTVEVNGARVHLTGKEYQILELLSLRRGTTLTREMFLTHLYGGMDEPELKIIDVFIGKLSKKLAIASNGRNYIETVGGQGYVLREQLDEAVAVNEALAVGEARTGPPATNVVAGRNRELGGNDNKDQKENMPPVEAVESVTNNIAEILYLDRLKDNFIFVRDFGKYLVERGMRGYVVAQIESHLRQYLQDRSLKVSLDTAELVSPDPIMPTLNVTRLHQDMEAGEELEAKARSQLAPASSDIGEQNQELGGQETWPPLPQVAPALWADPKARLPGDKPPDFIKRHYAPWLGRGLHRGHISKLDPELYKDLRNFIRRHDLPDDCPLPTVKEQTDQLVAAAFTDEGAQVSLSIPDRKDALRRLGIALQRREQRSRRERE